MEMNTEELPSQAIYAWAEKLDPSDVGDFPECYKGEDVYEVNIGTKDAAYGGWYFPSRYYIDFEYENYTEEQREKLDEWERECLADAGDMSHHGKIPENAIVVETHEDVMKWFEENTEEDDRKPSVQMLTGVDPSFLYSWSESALSTIPEKDAAKEE